MKQPFLLYLLIFSLIFLALGGLFGGIMFLIDPSGKSMSMDTVLPMLPVSSYVLPGLFLIAVMGLFPILLAYGLIARPDWPWAARLTGWSKHHWAWTGSIAVALILLIWLAVQAFMIGFRWPIQFVTLGNAILILATALAPAVQRFSRMQEDISSKKLSI